jgi:phage gpG-like protein
MTPEIKFELSAEAQALAARLGDGKVLGAVAQALDRENELTIAHISSVRMRGNNGKPFPAELHVLGIRTARYVKSLRRSNARVSESQVESSIGSNVKYAGIHEFGGVIKVGARKGTARLRTDKSGTLLRQRGHENLAVFARANHKRVKQVAYEAAAHEIHMPARRPVQSGIEDRQKEYSESISGAIVGFWEGHE